MDWNAMYRSAYILRGEDPWHGISRDEQNWERYHCVTDYVKIPCDLENWAKCLALYCKIALQLIRPVNKKRDKDPFRGAGCRRMWFVRFQTFKFFILFGVLYSNNIAIYLIFFYYCQQCIVRLKDSPERLTFPLNDTYGRRQIIVQSLDNQCNYSCS